MTDLSALGRRAMHAIDDRRADLIALSLSLHGEPELGFQEHKSAAKLSLFLEANGFAVQRGYKDVETAYRGDAAGRSSGPTVAILTEYDALPDIGHACGHNLIAMMGTAAAIGVRAVIEALPGRLAAVGTPAEEGGGGKVALVRAGGFADIDVAMMCHPSSRTLSGRTSLASNRVDVEFYGKAAHAAAQPDKGINALDGVIQTFNNVNAMRQQLRPEARIHGIITNGGSAANIIPEYAMAKFSVRALDRRYQQEVLERFIACAEGAAAATGTKLKVTVHQNSGYLNMVPSQPLAERWAAHMRALGQNVQTTVDDERMGSTDMGNVSQILPAIHPYIGIAPEGTPGHSTAFRDAAATVAAHESALCAAKALALVAIDALADPSLLARARAEFAERRTQGVVTGKA
ncbi:MAG TPA: M20 family metallopeptidase [Candidatus Limnocylindria bacterium]|nr:M20 family metallopeptidase [Candidatus Limnocylindria bacterium]